MIADDIPQTRPVQPYGTAGTPHVLRLTSVFEPPALTPDWVPYDPVGGMQHHTAELTRCLDRMGLRQTVFTSRLAGPAGRSRCGRQTTVVRTGLRLPVLRQLWAPPALVAALGESGAVDLVHAHAGEDLAVLPAARLVAARHRCPLVVTLHCSLRHTLRAVSPRGAALQLLGGAVERRAVAAADAVVTLTPSAARRLVADGVPARRVHVIPSGFPPELFCPGPAPSASPASAPGGEPDPFPDLPRPRIAYVGRLAAQKGVGTLLDAFARLPGGPVLLVVGDGPQRAALERRARPLGDRVRFTGFLPHRQIPVVLRNADVLVLPSRYEELGSVLVEAMAVGLPAVASRVGGIPDLVRDGHNGLLAAPGDPDDLARAVGRLLTEPDTAVRLAAAARRTAVDYTWPALAARVADVYRQLTARRQLTAVPPAGAGP